MDPRPCRRSGRNTGLGACQKRLASPPGAPLHALLHPSSSWHQIWGLCSLLVFSVHFPPLCLPLLPACILGVSRPMNGRQCPGWEGGFCQLRMPVRAQEPPSLSPSPNLGPCATAGHSRRSGRGSSGRGGEHKPHSHQACPGSASGAVTVGPEREERYPCCPARWKGTGPQSSLGTGWGRGALLRPGNAALGGLPPLGARAGYQGLLGLPGHVSAILGKSETFVEPQDPRLPVLTEWPWGQR